ncbi:hypothetical protein NE857_18840 [Nocardiopsis exhalans]|uniref:DUF4352 domain-containing protein n=1 Tax=Nocardiopsis exhalans TaxID=163604 RepID=A0ABY5CZN5_9ACTN|nr:hypothetical protein [Nocardiopsis exhalans]USY17401.1 hypothetical protein NE857_18840 [Nocardiopsis exhalans]
MTRTGWIAAVVSTVIALIVGFGTGWWAQRAATASPEPATAAQRPHPDDVEDRPETGFEAVVVSLDETHDFGDGLTIHLSGFERGVEQSGIDPVSGQEGDLPYLSWTVEVANEGDETVPTGLVTRSCSVGDPLRESGSPVLGDSVNPPDSLDPGQSGSWDEDCWADEGDTQIRYTVEFHDQDFVPLYPPVTFAGTVD